MSEETHDLYDIISIWWYRVHDIKNDGKNPERADLAMLRRIDLIEIDGVRSIDMVSALSIKSFRDLYLAVAEIEVFEGDGKKRLNDDQTERLVIIASSLARIRENAKGSLGEYIGGFSDDDRLVKEGRFKSLIRAQTNADLFNSARRLCAIMGKSAPVKSLSKTIYEWGFDSTRRKLATDYYHLNFSNIEN